MSDAINTAEVEVVSADAISNALVALGSGNISQDVFSTFDFAGDTEAADTVWFALTDSEPINQNLNQPITVTGVVVLRVELLNDQTGEVESQPRIVFVAEDKAYHVTSGVVFRDLRTLIALKGNPTPTNPVVVKFEKGGSGTRQFITLKPVRPAKK